MIPPPQTRWPRGPLNELHHSAMLGSTERTIALLSKGSINIDQGDPRGVTPLMVAAERNHSRVVRVLLGRGANASVDTDCGSTALHLSANFGHRAVTAKLIKAGANLEAVTSDGATPLHVAAQNGHLGVTVALVEAGAAVDSRSRDGCTPLFSAAAHGYVDIVSQLLRVKANALLTKAGPKGRMNVPLDVAVMCGYSKVVRELIKRRGIEGCAGPDGGLWALGMAAKGGRVDIMVMLMDAGVVDTGGVLAYAAGRYNEAALKCLLQQRQLEGTPTGLEKYANFGHDHGYTSALLRIVDGIADTVSSTRVVQLLIDFGADTTSAGRIVSTELNFYGTPLALTNLCLRSKKVRGGRDATEEQLSQLEAIRRLLLRADSVRAFSWLWHTDVPVDQRLEHDGKSCKKTKNSSTLRSVMLPILRRRARRHGLVLAPLFRHSEKPGHEPAWDNGDDSSCVAGDVDESAVP